MRMAFGLLSLLLGVGLVAYLYVSKSGNDIHTAQKATEQVEHMANIGADGTRADKSITLEPVNADGKVTGMKVTDILPGGPMQVNFGLKKGDTITRLNDARIGEF